MKYCQNAVAFELRLRQQIFKMGLTGFDMSSRFMGENQSYKRQTINNSERRFIRTSSFSCIISVKGCVVASYSFIFIGISL